MYHMDAVAWRDQKRLPSTRTGVTHGYDLPSVMLGTKPKSSARAGEGRAHTLDHPSSLIQDILAHRQNVFLWFCVWRWTPIKLKIYILFQAYSIYSEQKPDYYQGTKQISAQSVPCSSCVLVTTLRLAVSSKLNTWDIEMHNWISLNNIKSCST